MKLHSLWISEYKNIEDLTLNFDSNHLITLLVGKNGLGKSNLIEILALIFRDLDLLTKEEQFEVWSNPNDRFEYEIEYSCRGNDLKIVCKSNVFEVWKGNTVGEYQEITFRDFIKNRKEKYLPKYIIGYYSGENKRVRDIIKVHEEKQYDLLYRSMQGADTISSFRNLYFSENHHSQLILFVLIVYRFFESDENEFNSSVEDLFENYLQIEEIKNLSLHFKQPSWQVEDIGGVNKSIELIVENINSEVEFPFWNLAGKIDKLLTVLYDHQIDYGVPLAGLNTDEKREELEFDRIRLKELYNDVKKEFPSPLDFFDAIESTMIQKIDIFNKLSLRVKKEGISTPFEFIQLSEGEQQLLTVLGLLLIFGKEDCLFLLDEPDTHLNPQWQRDYVRLLDDFNKKNENSHIIVATHSPLIVQAADKADVFLFKKDENNKITVLKDPHRIANWRIDHVMMSKYFGLENSRPPSTDEFMKERELLLSKTDLSVEDIAGLKEISKTEDVFPTGETIRDVKALNTIHNIALRINKGDDKD
ncbi:AAA family ATPase [Ancylomarina longa]|uniref:Endonuclease GajA/Old nuclease/RecF-like AAA domain-containing protein n=1 Tax=Ancylomarina longa TaxID=2487017 RepID=A0A434AWP2_9BACT|nr:AAA family ATPase [Ancylomarina longa]RUT78944.1 hypothetical protein DLK05_05535 [Ancylomarina longa]